MVAAEVAVVAEGVELAARAEEVRCGVAAAPIDSQGAETHVSSVAADRAYGQGRQSEVSEKRVGEKIRNYNYFLVHK